MFLLLKFSLQEHGDNLMKSTMQVRINIQFIISNFAGSIKELLGFLKWELCHQVFFFCVQFFWEVSTDAPLPQSSQTLHINYRLELLNFILNLNGTGHSFNYLKLLFIFENKLPKHIL